MGRPRIHDEKTAEELIAAAGRVLAEEGAAALNLRRLAREVGVSTQAIYSLFGSKAGLVGAMHRLGFATLDRHLARVGPQDDPVAELRALAFAYRASAREQPHLYDVMFACPFPEFEPTGEDQRLALGTLDRLRATVARHAAAGAFGDRNPDSVALSVWALVHGLVSLELGTALGPPERAQSAWSEALDALLPGLTTSGEPRGEWPSPRRRQALGHLPPDAS